MGLTLYVARGASTTSAVQALEHEPRISRGPQGLTMDVDGTTYDVDWCLKTSLNALITNGASLDGVPLYRAALRNAVYSLIRPEFAELERVLSVWNGPDTEAKGNLAEP